MKGRCLATGLVVATLCLPVAQQRLWAQPHPDSRTPAWPSGAEARKELQRRIRSDALLMKVLGLSMSTALWGVAVSVAGMVAKEEKSDPYCPECGGDYVGPGAGFLLGLSAPFAICGITLAAAGITRGVLANYPGAAASHRRAGLGLFMTGVGLMVLGGGIAYGRHDELISSRSGPSRTAGLVGVAIMFVGGISLLFGGGVWAEADRALRIRRQWRAERATVRGSPWPVIARRDRTPAWGALPRTTWLSRLSMRF